MTTTLSVRIDTDTKKRLEALAKRSRRSKSFLAAEAIVAFVEAESWQLDEIQTGIKELDEGRGVPHKDVVNWLQRRVGDHDPWCPVFGRHGAPDQSVDH
jgi:RHH-type transcriptional regulator, rel operon repressor / antitoxin RelB